MVQRIWKRYSPFFHFGFILISMAFTAGAVLANVHGYEDRITALEGKQYLAEKRQIRMDGNLELLMRAMNVKPLPPVDREF